MSGIIRSQKVRVVGAIIATVGLYQNCGDGFKLATIDTSLPSTLENVRLVPGPTFPGVSMPNFKTCLTTSAEPVALSACLNKAPGATGITYTADAITTCNLAGQTTDLSLAMCLSKAGQVIQDHREAKQFDIDSCTAAVGAGQVAACLGKRGIRGRIVQEFIDRCSTSDGPNGIERCLRRNTYVTKRASVFQSDATLCERVEGGTASLALCLQNADLLPATVTQTQIDTCVTAVTSARVIRCLRVNYHIPKVVMQLHINECSTAVGQAAIATCLDNNGLLPVDPVTQLATFQTEVDGCVTAVGLAAVAKCLRNKNLLSPKIMQPHIASCFDVAGVNAFACLNANFGVVPAGLTDAQLRTCFAANMNTAANAAKCLASKRILSSAPTQENITACQRFAGTVPDATATRPGQVGIATCLDRSGLLAAPLVQANVDTCITNVGLANVATCLHNQGIVPSFSRMIAAGGVLQVSCSGCHNAGNMAGNLNVLSHASVVAKILPGNAAGSVLNMRINSAATPMPPTGILAANLRAPITRWIEQGGNDN